MSDEGHLVFVYGTLRRGASNAFRMDGAEWLHPGFVKGRLYKVDWYPAVVLDDHGGKVEGELWRLSGEKLRELDAFEGEEYRRSKVTVFSGNSAREVNEWDGDQAEAWIWEWAGETSSLEYLKSGDWLYLEKSEPGKLFTFMGCLSLIAMPIGGVVIANFIGRMIGWNSTSRDLFGVLAFVAAPVMALVLVRWADRRQEVWQGWRDLTTGVSMIWITGVVIAVFFKVVELLIR